MAKVLILVEGPTEERFVKDLVYPHLALKNVYIIPTIVVTKRLDAGTYYRGGHVPYDKMRNQLMKLLDDSSAAAVTTMLDYYGLPKDFPGRKSVRGKNCYEKVKKVEMAFGKDINNTRFIPYLQLHEYEGLLFSSPALIADNLEEPGTTEHKELSEKLQKIRDQFDTPEEINDDTQKHAKRRIINLADHYEPLPYGVLIAKKIGLDKIRNECPHFKEWLEKLEKLT